MRRVASILSIVILPVCFVVGARAQSDRARPPDDKLRAAVSKFEEGQDAQERGNPNTAVRRYTEAIALDPSLYQAYYQRAVALTALGQPAEAESDLRKSIELDPSFARAHRALGLLLLDRGLTADAKRELGRAIELDSKLKGARIYYASALIKLNEPAQALEQLRAAVEAGEATPLAYALLGVAEERTGKLEAAFADYSRAIEMSPENGVAREGRARLFESRGELKQAIEDYSVAYRAQPSPEIALTLAQLHLRTGQAQAAIELYRDLLRQRPDDFGLRAEIVRMLSENGQVEEAQREVLALVRARPHNAVLLVLAGDVYSKERPDLAVGYYREAIDADPADNQARVQLGASLVRSRQFAEALSVLGEAIAKDPDNVQAHSNLATALFELKQYPQAAGEFAWLVQKRPGMPVAYYFLAISFDKLTDCIQALKAYQEFIRHADPAANKKEIEDATIRVSLLQKLAKEGKCKSEVKAKKK